MVKRVRLVESVPASDTVTLIDTLQKFAPPDSGDAEIVETPDGLGFVDDVITGGSVDDMGASEDNPVYAVGMVEEATVNFYRENELSEGEFDPDIDLDDPVGKLADEENGETDTNALTDALAPTAHYELDVLQFGDFDYPPSWEEAETPARIILMDAWTSMGGQFDCGGGCCKSTMRQSGMGERASDQFCAAMKDAVLGTHDWRGGWAD